MFLALLKDDFVAVFDEIFRNLKLVRGLSDAIITLRENMMNPMAIEESRPISLIGSIYNVVGPYTSFIKVLNIVFFINQSTFIRDRNILDGGGGCNEIVDEPRKRKGSFCMFRLILRKHMIRSIGTSFKYDEVFGIWAKVVFKD